MAHKVILTPLRYKLIPIKHQTSDNMGGFQSRAKMEKATVTVAQLLKSPGLSVEKAGKTAQVTAVLKKRLEESVGSLEMKGAKRQKIAVDGETPLARFRRVLAAASCHRILR